jgi:hypothetical protein
MAQLLSRVGGEVLVNTITEQTQSQPAMIELTSGEYVIVWTSFVASGSFEIRGQRYAADGTPIDADFAISPSGGNHGEPRIAALPTGGFIVTWTYDAHDGTGVSAAAGTALRIRGQIFDSSAAKVGGVLALTSGNGSEQGDSQVITFADGSFALAWQNFLPAGERDALVQKFNSAGTATSGVVTISASTTGSQTQPALTALAGGGFVATWADTNSAAAGDSSSQGVKAQLFDSAGAKVGSEFLVNTIIPGQQYSPSVAALASGGFVVAWMSLSSTPFDPAFNDVKAQIFDAAGARVGGEFKVHEASEGEQVQPSVTALPGGGFVVAWRDGTLTDADVKAQAFDADGARSGTEFTLGTETDGLQSAPVVIGLANGGLAAAWVGTDDSGTGVKAQLFGTTDTAPSDIGFSSGSVSENLFENTSAGTLLAIGAANSGFTFEIVSDSTGGAFAVDGDQLIVVDNAKLDFETNPHATVTVRVTDDNGQTYEETLELDVADVLLEKRYSAGDEFIVNQSEAGPEYRPTLVPLASGGFAILWTQYTALPGEPTIYRTVLRVFDSAGAPVSGEIQLINPALADFTAAPLANGGFIVASNVANQPPGSRSVMAQAYDSAGNAVGPEMLAGSTTTGFPYGASVVQIGSGGFVLGWADQGEVSAQRFDAAGAKVGGEIPIATNFGADHFVLLATPNGGFVAAWEEGGPTGDGPYEAKAQFFDSSGAPVGAGIALPAGDIDVDGVTIVALADGGYMLGWVQEEANSDGITVQAVMAQRIGADGVPVGSPVLLTGFIIEDDLGPYVSFAAHPDGGFVVTWPVADLSGDLTVGSITYGYGGQLYDGFGMPVGDSFKVTDFADAGNAVMLADGSFAAAWTGIDSDDNGVFARVFRPANEPDYSGNDVLRGDGHINLLDGGAGNDILWLQSGGDDIGLGGSGNDVFLFGAEMTADDRVDGGPGIDQIALQGDYAFANALTLGSGVIGFESIAILPGSDVRFGDPGDNFYNYDITTLDVNVAAGVRVIVDANRLRVGEDFTFNGSAESDGGFFIWGGGGTDTLTGGTQTDIFYFGENLQFGANDTVDGGAGTDQLGLRGNYTIVFGANQIVGIENIGLVSAQDTRFGALGSTFNYNLTMNDANVASGVLMTVDGAALRGGETLTFNGSAETNGLFRIFGGQGNDTITTGAGADIIQGGRGADDMTGGGGADTFRYITTLDSTGAAMDEILDFAPGTDKIDLSRIDANSLAGGDQAFSWIGSNAFTGSGAASAGELRAYQNNGIWFVEGDTDGNGVADLVISLTVIGPTPLGQAEFVP